MTTWRDMVSGLSHERIAERITWGPIPSPLTKKFCEQWLWWWREMPVLWINGWKLKAHGPQKLHWLAHAEPGMLAMLEQIHNHGGIEQWLRDNEYREWNARLRGSTLKFGPIYGETFYLDLAQDVKKFTINIECDSSETMETVMARVRKTLKDVGFKGQKHPRFQRSPRTFSPERSKKELSGWLKIFTAVEIVDRATLLKEQLTDSQRRTINSRLHRIDRLRRDVDPARWPVG